MMARSAQEGKEFSRRMLDPRGFMEVAQVLDRLLMQAGDEPKSSIGPVLLQETVWGQSSSGPHKRPQC